MTEIGFEPESGDSAGGQGPQDEVVLKQALSKVVALGKEVGVSTEHMIRLLESGMTVKQLLEYLVGRGSGNA